MFSTKEEEFLSLGDLLNSIGNSPSSVLGEKSGVGVVSTNTTLDLCSIPNSQFGMTCGFAG